MRYSKPNFKKNIAVFLLFCMLFNESMSMVLAQEITPTPTNIVSNTIDKTKTATDLLAVPIDPQHANSKNLSNKSEYEIEATSVLPKLNPLSKEFANSARLKRKTMLKKFIRKSFQANEKVQVTVEIDPDNAVTLKITGPSGEEIATSYQRNDVGQLTTFEIEPPQVFVPGRYQMQLTDSVGQRYTQDFTWGVLAINTDKSIYLSKEKAHVTMAVLDENGGLVCDAKVELVITRPNGRKDVLSTEDKTIINHVDCTLKAYTPNPDYELFYEVSELGTYNMQLTAENRNGTYTIQDHFEVRDSVPFDVTRKGPTRIYPPSNYTVEVNVQANQDFSGVIEEIVPNDFVITKDSETPFDSVEIVQVENVGETLGATTVALEKPFEGKHPVTLNYGEAYHSDTLIDTISKKFSLKGHEGVDFDMPVGTELKAVSDGTVVVAGEHDYGITVTLEHAWGKTYYGHLSEVLVHEGELVKKGQVIALSGNSGESTAPHLHFGIKPLNAQENNGYKGMVDPLQYFDDKDGKVLGIQTSNLGSLKKLTWNADLKKGDKKILRYSFKAPNISPEFYLLGPLTFKNVPSQTQGEHVETESSIDSDKAIAGETSTPETSLIETPNVLLEATPEASVAEKSDESLEATPEASLITTVEKSRGATPEASLVKQEDKKQSVSTEVVFEELRKWQIAVDADVTIDAAAILGTARGMRNTVFTTHLIGYHFFIDADSDLKYYKTADGGATWGGLTVIKITETIHAFDVWYDQWTPGDTGSKIHIWYVGLAADDVVYETLDTANDDVQSSEVIVFNGATSIAGRGVFVSGAKMRGGNLYVGFDIDAGAEKGVRRSTDSGANWTIRYTTGTTDTIIEATIDQALFFPGNEADNQDLWILYQDASTNELTLKMHNDSANTTSESVSIVTLGEQVTDGTGQYGFSGTIRHSDGHLLVVTESEYDTAAADMQTWDINGTGSMILKSAISTNIDDQYYPQIFINQGTNTVRVAYIGKRDGTDTLGTTNGVYYTTSTDGMSTWTAGDTAYSATSSDWRNLWVPPMGPRFIASWRDISSQAIMTNFDNSIGNVASTIVLNAPVDAFSTTDTTPTFDFTGTDSDTDSLEYQIQVHTDNTFGTTITKADLTSGSGTNNTSFSTASITPSANKLVLLSVASRVSGGGTTAPTVTGNGLTWVLVRSTKEAASWNRISVFRAMGASPSSGATTISFGSITQLSAIWSVTEYTNMDTSGTNGSGAIAQIATNSGIAVTTLTATLGAFSATANATYGAIVSEVAGAITHGTDFTEIHDVNVTDNSLETEWKNSNDTTVDWSWGPTARVAGIGLEIIAKPLLNKFSVVPDTGFVNPDTGGDTHPFNSGENIQYTIQAGDELSVGSTYYWRVRSIDPGGTNTYSDWATTRSLSITAGGPTNDQVMRHGNWFSNGVEQSFTF